MNKRRVDVLCITLLLLSGCKSSINRSELSNESQGALQASQLVHLPWTFGWEAEFLGDTPSLSNMPYVDPVIDYERTGNSEIKSFGGEQDLRQVLDQMHAVKEVLGDTLKSFHFRMRIAKEHVAHISEKNLRGYLSRVGNHINAWRLRWRNPRFALRNITAKRLTPADLTHSRGTIRVVDLGDAWDIELRGFMGALDKISETVSLIHRAFQDSKQMEGYWEIEQALAIRRADLIEIARQRSSAPLKAQAERNFMRLEQETAYTNHQPLYEFEKDPSFTQRQRQRIAQANEVFFDQLGLLGQTALSFEQFQQRYYVMIKEWAQAADLSKAMTFALNGGSLKPDKLEKASIFMNTAIDQGRRSPNARIRAQAELVSAQRNGRSVGQSSWEAQRVDMALQGSGDELDILLLRSGSGSNWKRQLMAALHHESVDIRVRAWKVARERDESQVSNAELIRVYQSQGSVMDSTLKEWIGKAFFNSTKEPPGIEIAEGFVRDTRLDPNLRAKALSKVLRSDSPEAIALVEWASSSEGGLKNLVAQYLKNYEMQAKPIPKDILQAATGPKTIQQQNKPAVPEAAPASVSHESSNDAGRLSETTDTPSLSVESFSCEDLFDNFIRGSGDRL